ncbi:tkl protein kinase [Plasmopara halstedii]|uniref:Tkl protein kinase n=1 Tax=Plasmopara halstedii TaxID=4781 RepID=A0A0P1A771_PLAHL|nr:tkl protein kinase [Plasmopara halstedii]CEG36325.1 tkl protein kinase [Plasmopara halstedii]|eukprot:XP_024572694.1 tkl protein kinase [Plasmopara halstedii]
MVFPTCRDAAGSNFADQLSSSLQSSSSGSEVGIVPATTLAQESAQNWFIANVFDNETQLAVGVDSNLKNLSDTDIICNGAPSLQRLSSAKSPNFGCPDIFTAIGASCLCLSVGQNASDTWEFHVAKSSSGDKFPVLLTAVNALLIDSIRTLLVPPTLKTLRIFGEGIEPQNIQFIPMDRRDHGSVLPLAISNGSISISTVEIKNINMFSITISAASFLPPSTKNLTLRNCNLFAFGPRFFDGLTHLQHLDLSSNSLTVPYVGSTTQSSCSNQFCAVETLNLTNNSLTTFPTAVLNIDSLRELYIAQNDITDFKISMTTFNAIKSLRAFESDLPDISATCPDGTWQTAHRSNFCVTNTTIAESIESSPSSWNQCTTYVVVIAGCLISALIVLLFRQRNHSRPRTPSSVSLPAAYYLSQSGNNTINIQTSDTNSIETLLKDPLIINNRLNFSEITLRKCLSRGGFGLVFLGEFKGRQVAVKKIRPDRSNDPQDLKAFLREIILMARLSHPRIVEYIGVAWDRLQQISAVTEYMESGDLRHVLRTYQRQGNPLTWTTSKISIALHIAEALQYLHSHTPKVIHRDLKSKNVLINMHLEAKLTDFGVARMQSHAMTAGIGTSFWIAPEVLLGREYDEQADIYSFGVVLSEIDTNDYPFWNDANCNSPRGKLQEADILRQVVTGNKRPQFSPDCPDGILSIATVCLQENPKDRPNALAVVAALQQLLRPSLHSDSLR